MYDNVFLIYALHSPYTTIIILSKRRRIILHKHHLCTFLECQHLVRGIAIFRENAIDFSLEVERRRLKLRQLTVIIMVSHGVMSCQSDIALVCIRMEIRMKPSVQLLHIFSRRTPFSHMVQEMKKANILLSVNVFEFYGDVGYLRKCMTSKEIRGRIMRLQHAGILLSYYRSELLEVAHHEQLNATKGLHGVLEATQHRVNRIQKVASNHTDFIDNEEVKRSDDVPFFLRYPIFSLDNGIWNIRRKGQLKERMNGHSTRIDSCNTCRCNHNQPLLAFLHYASKECSLTRSGLSRKEYARTCMFHKLPSLLKFDIRLHHVSH